MQGLLGGRWELGRCPGALWVQLAVTPTPLACLGPSASQQQPRLAQQDRSLPGQRTAVGNLLSFVK